MAPRHGGHAEMSSACFMVAGGGVLYERYGRGVSAWAMARRRSEGVPSQGGREDEVFRRKFAHLT